MVALLRVLGQPLPVLNAQGPSAKVWRPWRALPTEVQDAPMRSVEADAACVEQRLLAGDYACPVCEGELRPWGFARWRIVGRGAKSVRLRPRRSRCKACRLTHVLLPVACLLRRCDLAEMVGRGLALKVAGWGYRRIAASLGIPSSTVGDRGRRFEKLAGYLRAWFTALLYFLDPSFGAIDQRDNPLADALEAIVLAAGAAARAFGPAPLWNFASGASSGRLLANTNPSLPPAFLARR